MNTPEMTELEIAAKVTENESIRLMREQSNDLIKKINNTRVVWWMVIVLTFVGTLLPSLVGLFLGTQKVESAYIKIVSVELKDPKLDTIDSVKKAVSNILDNVNTTTSPESRKILQEARSKFEKKYDQTSSLMELLTYLGFFTFPLAYLLWIPFYRSRLEKERYRIEYKIIQTKAQELQDNIGQDFFTTLVRINFKYLDSSVPTFSHQGFVS